MPVVKKTRKIEAAATQITAAPALMGRAVAPPPSASSFSHNHLPAKEIDDVKVYDTCDEICRKVNERLKMPVVAQVRFCRDLYAQLRMPKTNGIQSMLLADFRTKKGPRAGNTTSVFHAAYVYFEKKRIAEG
ncbi:hypothetical protein DL768_005781 [Monosporascus sp. mg162]|nr:hypothetical protein DL768_005781 [Monosporascus sp. mg162]